MNILYTYPETIVDGEGIRYSIYLAGCRHGCPGCHNPESWNPQAGDELTEKRLDCIIREINSNPLLDGVTFSGGDPLYNPEAFLPLIRRIKEETGQNIWCYTGYTFETLLRNPLQAKLLQYIDVLVDGKFKQELRDESLCFRGSKNQRLIDVQASLQAEEVVTYNYNPVPRIA